MFVDQKAIDYFTNEVYLAKVNAEVDTLTAQRFKVSGYPTSVLVNSDGSEIDRIIGYAPTDEYLGMITDYRNGIGTLDDLLNKAKKSSDRLLAMEIAEKYKYRGGSEEAMVWYDRVIEDGELIDSLSGEARMAIADMLRRAKNYTAAREAFEAIQKDFDGQSFSTDAEIWVAIVYSQAGDTTTAISKYEGYINNHPESEDVDYAKRQIAKLKGEEIPKKGN